MARIGHLIAGAAAAALVLGVAGASMSSPGGDGRGARMFERLDADGDGVVTREEAAAAGAARLKSMDRDGDGAVTQAEIVETMMERMRPRMEARAERMMKRADADGDGSISEAEMAAAPMNRGRMERMFDRVDADGDGSVTREEAEAMAAMRGGRHDKRGRHGHQWRDDAASESPTDE